MPVTSVLKNRAGLQLVSPQIALYVRDAITTNSVTILKKYLCKETHSENVYIS